MSRLELAIAAALLLAGCESLLGVDDLRVVGPDGGTGSGDAATETAAVGHDAASDSSGELAAVAEASIDAMAEADATPACVMDLSNVGTADFHISFTLTTSASFATGTSMALINQRSGCDEASTFWDITMDNQGGIVAVTDDGMPNHLVTVEAGNAINDGQPHRVVVSRVAGQIYYSKDGIVGSAMVADTATFGELPMLTVGSDPCPGTTSLAGNGTLTNLCVTSP